MLTLHIELQQKSQDTARLRYYFDNPNAFEERDLKLGDITPLIKDAETRYYTVLPGDLIDTGRHLYTWLDSAERFLATAIEEARGTTEGMILAISTQGPLAHLPWEVLHDGTAFLVQRTNPFIVPVRWRKQMPPETNQPTERYVCSSWQPLP